MDWILPRIFLTKHNIIIPGITNFIHTAYTTLSIVYLHTWYNSDINEFRIIKYLHRLFVAYGRRKITYISRNLLMLFFALGVFLFQGANAQLANVPTCSCSPLIYKWTLDFTRNCASTELSLGIGSITGLASIECDITMVNTTDPIDLVPVALTSYELIELSTDRLAPVKINSETDLYFQDGQHLALTSETAANPSLVSGGVKGTIGAVNLSGHGIELSWLIRYTNVCEAKPFEVGDSIGWAVLVSSGSSTRSVGISFSIYSVSKL